MHSSQKSQEAGRDWRARYRGRNHVGIHSSEALTASEENDLDRFEGCFSDTSLCPMQSRLVDSHMRGIGFAARLCCPEKRHGPAQSSGMNGTFPGQLKNRCTPFL